MTNIIAWNVCRHKCKFDPLILISMGVVKKYVWNNRNQVVENDNNITSFTYTASLDTTS